MPLYSEVHYDRVLATLPELECGIIILRHACNRHLYRCAHLYRLKCKIKKKLKPTQKDKLA